MYTQKLKVNDLQSKNVNPFEGTAVYAHQKVSLVPLSFAEFHEFIFLFSNKSSSFEFDTIYACNCGVTKIALA